MAQTGSMRFVPGGNFTIGSERFYPEEAPTARVSIAPFEIDVTPVTNAEFAAFVADTGYVTLAEVAPDPAAYPGMPLELAQPGSLVFDPSKGPPNFDEPNSWWRFVIGADWRHPYGQGSSVDGLEDHPVVHVAYRDAATFADWAGKALPTETEWERAARGGFEAYDYAWGSELAPGGKMMANYWQGSFPETNLLLDGWHRTSPVGTFPPNGFGLHDMIGNVWEWTADFWSLRGNREKDGRSLCCSPPPYLGSPTNTGDHVENSGPQAIETMVLKGGSHLCAENYCYRYRPAARIPQAVDSATCHVGFRCVIRIS